MLPDIIFTQEQDDQFERQIRVALWQQEQRINNPIIPTIEEYEAAMGICKSFDDGLIDLQTADRALGGTGSFYNWFPIYANEVLNCKKNDYEYE